MANSITCLHRGGDIDTTMYWCTATQNTDGSLTCGGDTRAFGGDTVDAPALCWFGSTLIAAYRDANNNNLNCYAVNGSTVIGPVLVGSTESLPSLYSFNNTLFCVWQQQSTSDIYFATCTSFDGKGQPIFSAGKALGGGNQMICGASMVNYNGTLYCFHRGKGGYSGFEGDQNCYYALYDPTQNTWTADSVISYTDGSGNSGYVISAYGPSVVVFQNRIVCVNRGEHNYDNDDQLLYTIRLEQTANNSLIDADSTGEVASGNLSCAYEPSLIVLNNNLYCIHPHYHGDPTMQWAMWDSTNLVWNGDNAFPGNGTNAGVGVAPSSSS